MRLKIKNYVFKNELNNKIDEIFNFKFLLF